MNEKKSRSSNFENMLGFNFNLGNLLEFEFNIEDLLLRIDANIGIVSFNDINSSTLPKIREARLHTHDSYEFFFNLTEKLCGSFEGFDDVIFDRATIIIVPPKIKHKFFEKSWVNSLSFKFTIKRNAVKSKLGIYKKFSEFCTTPYAQIKCSPKMCELLLSLKTALKTRDSMNVSALIYTLIVAILTSEEKTKHEEIPVIMDTNQSRSSKLSMMIDQFYTHDITLKDIALSLNMSNRQVIRIVKQLYGCTFREQITKLRMDTAARILKDTPLSVTEISSKLGYNSSNSFTQTFKKYFGVSPSQYRK